MKEKFTYFIASRRKGNQHSTIKGSRLFIIFLISLFSSLNVLANYTIASGSTVNASTITGQSGVLTINGTLNVSSNVSLLGFTSVIINGPNGQIYWQNNSDITFSAGTTFLINNSAPGLQPTGGNASKRLIVGSITIAVSNDNSNNAAFSFTEFNGLGGLPQFNITTTPACLGNATTITATPSLTSSFVFRYFWSISPTITLTPASSSSSGASSTSITPAALTTYTVTLNVRDINNDLIATKTANIAITGVPSLSTATQAATVCEGFGAQINLSGLVANSTNNTIAYSINGVAQTPVSGVNANGSGAAAFTSAALTAANNGQTLTVTRITSTVGCFTNVTKNITLSVRSTGTWLGVSNDWFNAGNWCNGIPSLTTDVTIPNGVANYPVITSGTALVKSISIANASSVQLSATMRIAGSITNSGTFNAINGIIDMAGTGAAQTIQGSSFTSRSIAGLIISNTSGVSISSITNDTLNIISLLSFGNVNNAILNTNNNLTLRSTSIETARIADITNAGVNTGNAIIGKVIVERYVPGRRSWRLMTAPITAASDLTISQAWQESTVDVTLGQRVDPKPGYGTHITGGSNRNSTQGFDKGPNNSSIYFYNYVADGWGVIPATTNNLALDGKITDQEGYLIFVRGSRNTNLAQATGAATSPTILRPKGYLKQGTQTITLPAGNGFKVIGNPYASAIKFDDILLRDQNANGVIAGNNYYLWDPRLTGTNSVGCFVGFTESATPGVYVPTVYSPNSETSSINADGKIESGAAFMIRSTNGGTLDIRETDKISGSNLSQFRPAKNQVRTSLYAQNADGTRSLNDGVISFFDDRFSNEATDKEDMLKMGNIAENLAIKRNGTWWSAEKRKPIAITDTLYYEMWNMKQKTYEFEIAVDSLIHPNLTAYVEDSYLKKSTLVDMKDTTKLKFSVTADKGTSAMGRFKLVFKPLINFNKLQAEVGENNDILLDWSVIREQHINHYEIERSIDGIHFSKQYIQSAKNTATSVEDASYTWIDVQPDGGRYYYYRVRCIGKNHADAYSNIVKVKLVKHTPVITVYPNPVTNGIIGLQMINMPTGTYGITLLNNNGHKVFTKMLNHTEGYTENISVSESITPGLYNLEIIKTDKTKTTLKIMIAD